MLFPLTFCKFLRFLFYEIMYPQLSFVSLAAFYTRKLSWSKPCIMSTKQGTRRMTYSLLDYLDTWRRFGSPSDCHIKNVISAVRTVRYHVVFLLCCKFPAIVLMLLNFFPSTMMMLFNIISSRCAKAIQFLYSRIAKVIKFSFEPLCWWLSSFLSLHHVDICLVYSFDSQSLCLC